MNAPGRHWAPAVVLGEGHSDDTTQGVHLCPSLPQQPFMAQARRRRLAGHQQAEHRDPECGREKPAPTLHRGLVYSWGAMQSYAMESARNE